MVRWNCYYFRLFNGDLIFAITFTYKIKTLRRNYIRFCLLLKNFLNCKNANKKGYILTPFSQILWNSKIGHIRCVLYIWTVHRVELLKETQKSCSHWLNLIFIWKKSFNIKEMHILYTCNQWILKKPDVWCT